MPPGSRVSPSGPASRGLRVWGREGAAGKCARPAQPSPTSGKAGLAEERGGERAPCGRKRPGQRRGHKGPPRRAPRPLGPQGGPRRRQSAPRTHRATVARPGAVARGPLQGAWPGDLSPEAAASRRQTETAPRSGAPGTPALRPARQLRPDPTPISRGRRRPSSLRARGRAPQRGWPPPAPPRPPASAAGVRTAGQGRVRYPAPSVQPLPRKEPARGNPPAQPRRGRGGEGGAGQASRPRCPLEDQGAPCPRLRFIQQLLSPGQR